LKQSLIRKNKSQYNQIGSMVDFRSKTKRFFKDAETVEIGNFFQVELDGNPLVTPEKRLLKLSTRKLADAVCNEWREQDKKIDAKRLKITQLANTAIDKVGPKLNELVSEVPTFVNTDLLCYRVNTPEDLAIKQNERWSIPVNWLRTTHEIDLAVTQALQPIEQAVEAVTKLKALIACYDAFQFSGLLSITSLTGSIILAISLTEGFLDAEQVYEMAFLDEIYQESRWGTDHEATSRREYIREEIRQTKYFIQLLN